MDRKQTTPISPTANLDKARENVLYRHSIANFISNISVMASRLKDNVRRLKAKSGRKIWDKDCTVYVLVKA